LPGEAVLLDLAVWDAMGETETQPERAQTRMEGVAVLAERLAMLV
jgi:hypothetical protein